MTLLDPFSPPLWRGCRGVESPVGVVPCSGTNTLKGLSEGISRSVPLSSCWGECHYCVHPLTHLDPKRAKRVVATKVLFWTTLWTNNRTSRATWCCVGTTTRWCNPLVRPFGRISGIHQQDGYMHRYCACVPHQTPRYRGYWGFRGFGPKPQNHDLC